MRLFFAIWPDDPAREALARLASTVAAATGGRATPEANIHMTLEFLGEVGDERLGDLGGIAAAAGGRAFDLRLDRLGGFRRARVAWAGATLAPPALLELHSALSRGLAAAGFGLEERPFAPHVTLARKVDNRGQSGLFAPDVTQELRDVPLWRVGEFALVRTHAGRYATLASWRLAAR